MLPSSTDLVRGTAGTAGAAGSIALTLLLLLTGGCNLVADGHNAQGVRDMQAGQFTAAMQRFQNAAQLDPANADAIYNMAAATHRQGLQSSNRDMLHQSEILYNQALDLSPNHADAYRGLAVLLVQTDRTDKAFRLLRNWKANNPQVPDAHIELARLEQEFGNIEAAKTHLYDATMLDQRNARLKKAWAYLEERDGNYEAALAKYKESYGLHPDQAVAARIQSLNQVVATRSGTPAEGTRTVRANNQGWTPRRY